jgi:hypothetical protein
MTESMGQTRVRDRLGPLPTEENDPREKNRSDPDR